ncbi:tyrosine-type recombinase/integrase [Teichococcus vastitatis]|uniref:Tyrosine-type recombinase/integrase n=1 Tax=Teichococcus vastitatis TaxID=2307076 RepID=A0ABS9W8E8_9PROT|nr:tyrosine-type recombinase/integrase [Pseudoroseomonas vastitatis]MCI0755501.1 tyrosine-type recombinase/integrase [Pseudoroseomonas vastitatis]
MKRDPSGVPLPHTRPVMPWNKGRFISPKPPLKPKQVWAIRFHLQREQPLRDLALFDLAIDSKLRGCDLVRLTIGQLVVNGTARHRATVIQRKTEQPVQFELTGQTRDSVLAWLALRGGTLDEFVFRSRSRKGQHLSTRQYARLVGEWVEVIGLGRSAYGTHSLRRTKVALIYKRTGNLRATQILLGHTKLESTVRYLGVDAEDALTLSEAIEI